MNIILILSQEEPREFDHIKILNFYRANNKKAIIVKNFEKIQRDSASIDKPTNIKKIESAPLRHSLNNHISEVHTKDFMNRR